MYKDQVAQCKEADNALEKENAYHLAFKDSIP